MNSDSLAGGTEREHIEVRIDGRPWHVSYSGEYDAIHAVAGALIAGADEVVVERKGADSDG